MTLKQDAPGVIKRAERFQVILIGEGIIVGVVSGLIPGLDIYLNMLREMHF